MLHLIIRICRTTLWRKLTSDADMLTFFTFFQINSFHSVYNNFMFKLFPNNSLESCNGYSIWTLLCYSQFIAEYPKLHFVTAPKFSSHSWIWFVCIIYMAYTLVFKLGAVRCFLGLRRSIQNVCFIIVCVQIVRLIVYARKRWPKRKHLLYRRVNCLGSIL